MVCIGLNFLTGCLLGRCLGQGHLRQDVHLAGSPCQQDSGHQEQATVFHRCTGYRRIRDLRGLNVNILWNDDC